MWICHRDSLLDNFGCRIDRGMRGLVLSAARKFASLHDAFAFMWPTVRTSGERCGLVGGIWTLVA